MTDPDELNIHSHLDFPHIEYLSATYEVPSKGRYQSSWSFGLYNVYGRENPYSIDFKVNENDPQKIDAVQTSLFRWIPSVTYNFKF